MTVYFDWNATSPRHHSVRRRMEELEASIWANPSSVHSHGRAARSVVEDVRETMGRLFSKSPRDIVFTGGGTEANQLALNGVRFLVTSRIEHPSIVAQAEHLAEQGALVEFAEVTAQGVVTPEAVESSIARLKCRGAYPEPSERDGGVTNRNTPLIAVMAANHETGVIQPTEELAEVARASGARLHVDAVQLVGKRALSPLEYADSISISAHKFRGPKGVGALLFECGFVPIPLAFGGAQERGLRPGTVDAVAVAGMGAALERLDESQSAYVRTSELRDRLETILLQEGKKEIVVHARDERRLGHVINLRVPGWKGDELVAALDLEGVSVSSGSACSAGSSEPSVVIASMLGRDAAEGAVRISFGEESTERDLGFLTEALRRLGVLL